MSYRSNLLPNVALAALALSIGACADATSAPTTPGRPSLSAVKFWEVGSSVALIGRRASSSHPAP